MLTLATFTTNEKINDHTLDTVRLYASDAARLYFDPSLIIDVEVFELSNPTYIIDAAALELYLFDTIDLYAGAGARERVTAKMKAARSKEKRFNILMVQWINARARLMSKLNNEGAA